MLLPPDHPIPPLRPLAPPRSRLRAAVVTFATAILTLGIGATGYLVLLFGPVTGSDLRDLALVAALYAVAGLAFLCRPGKWRITLLALALAVGLVLLRQAFGATLH